MLMLILMIVVIALADVALIIIICKVLRNLVPFVQFKKREKHLWKNVTFSKVTG